MACKVAGVPFGKPRGLKITFSQEKLREPKSEKLQKESSREVQFFLLGEKYTESNAINAYTKIMKTFARDKDFITHLAQQTAGRKHKWLSQNLEDLTSSKRAKAKEISSGLWLDTHLSNEEKIKRLKMACKVAGVPFGEPRGLKITFQSKN